MEQLKTELKQLIISSLELEDISVDDIDDAAPLFVEGLGWIQLTRWNWVWRLKRYNIKIDANEKQTQQHFASINNLAAYVKQQAVLES